MSPIERQILGKLADGPRWARSFDKAKRTCADLITAGYIARCAPPGGRAHNMLELTDKGSQEAAKGWHWADKIGDRLADARALALRAERQATDERVRNYAQAVRETLEGIVHV